MAAEAVEEYGEVRLMADGCVALMRLVFGESNWQRWNEIKNHSQLTDLQAFVSWLLDVAEQELNTLSNTNTESVPTYYKPSDMGRSRANLMPEYAHHQMGVEPSSNSDVCTINPATFVTIKEGGDGDVDEITAITSHQDTTDEEDLQMDVFANEEMLEIIFLSDTSAFFCGKCEVSLNNVEIIKEHMSLRHSNQTFYISCHCCQKRFVNIGEYVNFHKVNRIAQNMSHGISRKTFICDYCAKPYGTKINLDDHVANTHLKLGPRYQCPTCQKAFTRANNLASHKKKCGLITLK